MLAYVFWHRPALGADVQGYERSQVHFHRSLRARSPLGFRGSANYRVTEMPWAAGEPTLAGNPNVGYEDWYLVEDWTALGVLNAAAVGVGHRSAHDDAAHHYADGSAGLYKLLEGVARPLSDGVVAWVTPPRGLAEGEIGPLLLDDGVSAETGALWRRELVLGPAAEYCVLAPAAPAGIRESRLPAGWHAHVSERDAVWVGERQ